MDDYIYGLPDGHEYKTLFLLMDGYKSYIQECTDSVEHVLSNNGSPEAKTLLGIITIDKGDTISGMNMVKYAAEQGCSLAELLLTHTRLERQAESRCNKACHNCPSCTSRQSDSWRPLL